VVVGGDVTGGGAWTANGVGVGLLLLLLLLLGVGFGDEDDCADGCYEASGRASGVGEWYFFLAIGYTRLSGDWRRRGEERKDSGLPMFGRYPALGTLRTRRASEIC
jgi:hypothetical protein